MSCCVLLFSVRFDTMVESLKMRDVEPALTMDDRLVLEIVLGCKNVCKRTT